MPGGTIDYFDNQVPATTSTIARRSGWRLAGVLPIAVFLVWAIYGHRFGLNDTKYFQWGWQHLPSARVWPVMLFGIPFFLGQYLYIRRPMAVAGALALVMLSMLLLMWGYTYVQETPPNPYRTGALVENPADNGYYYDAALLVQHNVSILQMLRNYPHYLNGFHGHVFNKPPALVMLNMICLEALGVNSYAALFSGFLMGLGAIFGVAATYIFILHFTANGDGAFAGASFFALCPGLLLYFPQYDQSYPLLTVALAVTWSLAIRKDRFIYSAAFGLVFGLTLFTNYLLVVLMIFLIGFAVMEWWTNPQCRLSRIFMHGFFSIGCFLTFYIVLRIFTGFDPIATFWTAWDRQQAKLAMYPLQHLIARTLPGTIPWDLYDFALGAGWISFPIALFFFLSAMGPRSEFRPHLKIALLCVGQFVLVAVLGLVQGEAWRLWIFMFPMLMLPVGMELGRWSSGSRLMVYAALLVLATVMSQSLVFLI